MRAWLLTFAQRSCDACRSRCCADVVLHQCAVVCQRLYVAHIPRECRIRPPQSILANGLPTALSVCLFGLSLSSVCLSVIGWMSERRELPCRCSWPRLKFPQCSSSCSSSTPDHPAAPRLRLSLERARARARSLSPSLSLPRAPVSLTHSHALIVSLTHSPPHARPARRASRAHLRPHDFLRHLRGACRPGVELRPNLLDRRQRRHPILLCRSLRGHVR